MLQSKNPSIYAGSPMYMETPMYFLSYFLKFDTLHPQIIGLFEVLILSTNKKYGDFNSKS